MKIYRGWLYLCLQHCIFRCKVRIFIDTNRLEIWEQIKKSNTGFFSTSMVKYIQISDIERQEYV